MTLSIIFPIEMNSQTNAGIAGHPNSDTTAAIKQNMKMLLLTRKGEYVFDADFGVGLHDYLFENDATISTPLIEGQIRSQTRTYMPYVEIDNINILLESDYQCLKVQIKFRYNGLSIPELFEVEVS